MGVIKQLKQFITGTNIFPITKTNAVYDDTVGRLDTFMQNILVGADTLESETEDTPRDADTLGGHLQEYFAKQSDLDILNSSLTDIIIVNRVNTTPTTINANTVKSYTVTAPQVDGYKPIMALNASNSLGNGNIIAFEGARGFTNGDSVLLSLKNLGSSAISNVYLVAYVLYIKIYRT